MLCVISCLALSYRKPKNSNLNTERADSSDVQGSMEMDSPKLL